MGEGKTTSNSGSRKPEKGSAPHAKTHNWLPAAIGRVTSASSYHPRPWWRLFSSALPSGC